MMSKIGKQIEDEGLRRAAREARAPLLRAVDCLTAEERDRLMDPVYTAGGRALWALTQALLPETAELPGRGRRGAGAGGRQATSDGGRRGGTWTGCRPEWCRFSVNEGAAGWDGARKAQEIGPCVWY